MPAGRLVVAALLAGCLAGALVLTGQESGQAARAPDLRAELDRLASERETIVRDFEAADVELALRRQQLQVLEQRGAALTEQSAARTAEIEQLETELTGSRARLLERVQLLYRVGPLSYNRLLLTADSSQEALIAYQIVTYMAARDRDLTTRVRQTLADLEEARTSLADTSAGLADVQADTAAAVEAIAEQQLERQRLLSRIDREAEAQRVALASAERAETELSGTMSELATGVDVAGSFGDFRGQLEWPAQGDIVTGFGRQRHPIYDTYTVSRGIEIEAPLEDPVTAVHPGRVAFADWYSGYGLLVILDHGGGYFTLYGHLANVSVRVNDQVAAGQLIGRVGETGSLTGPNLYFEVREGADALNPTSWLRRR